MTESFTKKDNNQKSVYFRIPKERYLGSWFCYKENKGIKDKVNEELINVFVPTTPNPTSGFLLMIPKKI